MDIGKRIKQRRIELGLDVDELAVKIGKSRATIYRYENGDIENMPTTVLEPIAKALETTPAYLMGWERNELLHKQKESRKKFAKEWNLRFYENKMLESFTQLNDDNKKKSIFYTENLLSNQVMEEELLVNAAHERTDIEVTAEMHKADDDIMNDDNF